MFLISQALAQTTTAPAPSGGASFLQSPLIMMVAIFLIFYFVLIRPQQKQQKARSKMISELKVGDLVMTTSGMHGKIVSVSDQLLTVEVAENVRIKFTREAIAGLASTQASKKVENKNNNK